MKNSKRGLLALNLTERGGAICTKEPPASPLGEGDKGRNVDNVGHNSEGKISPILIASLLQDVPISETKSHLTAKKVNKVETKL